MAAGAAAEGESPAIPGGEVHEDTRIETNSEELSLADPIGADGREATFRKDAGGERRQGPLHAEGAKKQAEALADGNRATIPSAWVKQRKASLQRRREKARGFSSRRINRALAEAGEAAAGGQFEADGGDSGDDQNLYPILH